ncbi:hypothetical protein HPB48_005642 [Haemaphysalis longicornis]|uniref:Uncharacterized protein n=1 Tax=Haemaphysalis longicornis TaxID=44386 RepID=A0A9J6G9Z3_HAELO|nr:hypothetical protein HPB48_005642 [Haemaphysalis longicornis]
MDEKFILLDAAISKHVKISSTPERTSDPRILIRYLDRSNLIAVDTDDCGVRDALLTITQLPINGKPTPVSSLRSHNEKPDTGHHPQRGRNDSY